MRFPSIADSKSPEILALLKLCNGNKHLLESMFMNALDNSKGLREGVSIHAVKAEIEAYYREKEKDIANPVHQALKAVVEMKSLKDIAEHRQTIIDCLSEKLNAKPKV